MVFEDPVSGPPGVWAPRTKMVLEDLNRLRHEALERLRTRFGNCWLWRTAAEAAGATACFLEFI